MFISFDGIDGSGKSTQIKMLAEHLAELGSEVVCFRDPGATVAGEAIREILLHREEIPLATTTEMLLYMSARAQLVSEQIRPALAAGMIVLCDRYLLANVVYQGYGGGLDPETIWQVGNIATGGLQPDITLLLDIDVPTAMNRVGASQDRLEKRGKAYFAKLRQGYLSELPKASVRFAVIDASKPLEEVFTIVKDQTVDFVSQRS